MSKKPEATKPAQPPKDRELTSRDLETVSGGLMRASAGDTSNTALQADITPDKGDGCDKA